MELDRNTFGKMSTACHMCNSAHLNLVLNLGSHPHSDDFLSKERLTAVEYHFPLRLVSCQDCGLLQIDHFVDPKILYQTNYIYESSITKSGTEHYRAMAQAIAERFNFKSGSLAVDIGSNVGVLLSGFKEEGFTVLGVDPAAQIAAKAQKRGIETIVDFFTEDVADAIVAKQGQASVITGTNVFAHLHDLDGAVKGMKKLLAKDGVIVIEAPYAVDLIAETEYDTIYHQHIGYLSVKPMKRYFEQFDLELFDVEKVSIHGGSLRYFVGHAGMHPVQSSVDSYIQEEEKFGLYSRERLAAFADDVQQQRQELVELLVDLKAKGNRIVGVSAPAKGNTLLNYCRIDTHFFDYITEKSQLKQGLYTPGTHIPIRDDEMLLKTQPDYALILAWNFADEIMNNLSEYKRRGGKFIIPIPKPIIK